MGKHLSDQLKEHKVLPFKRRDQLLKTQSIYSSKLCELYCEQCDIRICATCGSAKEYQDHKLIEIIKTIARSKNLLQKDLQV